MTIFCACKLNKDIYAHIPLSMYTQNLWHFNQNNKTYNANIEQKNDQQRNSDKNPSMCKVRMVCVCARAPGIIRGRKNIKKSSK